jgi:phosphatidylglycerophosphatase A
MASRAKSPADRLFLALGTCGFSGFLCRAAGTVGSLLGTLAYPYTFRHLNGAQFCVLYPLLLLLSVWVCGRCERLLGTRDPGAVNLDEWVAMALCHWPAEHLLPSHSPAGWLPLLVGFLLFRFFDIKKPLGIQRLQRLPGGWGIVLDDIAAALVTGALLCISSLLPGFSAYHTFPC